MNNASATTPGDEQASVAVSTDDRPSPPPTRRRHGRRRWIVRLLVFGGLIGYLWFVGLDSKFYYPDNFAYSRPADFGLRHEDVRFTTADGVRLHGWFLFAQGTPRGVVVHFHGNAANISNHIALIEWLARAGYHVLMFDYRGYGESEGRVTRAGTTKDGDAALEYALSRPEARDLPVFAYGQSLGGAVAIVTAAKHPEIRAVVAESTFSSYRRIAARHATQLLQFSVLGRAMAWLTISSGDDPIDAVGQLAPRPLLVIAAADDQVCYPELARELYDAAHEPKEFWLVPDAGHLEIPLVAQEELRRRVMGFFEKATNQDAQP